MVFRARRFAVRAARRAPLDLYLPHCVSFLPCWLRWSAVVAGDPATRAASGPGSRVAGAAASAASWRTQRIRSAAAWGWSPNSCAVITEAGIDPRVAGLVYIAARAPDAGEDYAALAQKFPAPPANAGLIYTGGFGGLTEDAFLNDFANGVDPVRARVLYGVQGRVSESLFHERTTAAAWRSKPSWYAISRQDRTISPELQRFLAKRMNATTVEIDSGHLSLITHPQ